MKLKLITVNKPIPGIIESGTYFEDDVRNLLSKYPVDFNNELWFSFKECDALESGTKVMLDDEMYYIFSVAKYLEVDSSGNKRLWPLSVDMYGHIDLKYEITKSMTDPQKEHCFVYSKNIRPLEVYWFINSSGKICSAVKGNDRAADAWRMMNANMFDSMEAACSTRLDMSMEI